LGWRWRHFFCCANRCRDSGPDQPKDGEEAEGNPNYVYYKLAAMGYGQMVIPPQLQQRNEHRHVLRLQ
jgi:hypothetical protein